MEKLEKITASPESVSSDETIVRGKPDPAFPAEVNLIAGEEEMFSGKEKKSFGKALRGFFSSLKEKFTRRSKGLSVPTDEDEFEENDGIDENAEDAECREPEPYTGTKKKLRLPEKFPLKSINPKNILVAGCLALIAVAGYVNIRYYSEHMSGSIDPAVNITEDDPGSESVTPVDEENENDDYFSIAVIARQRSRDESIELLMTMLESEGMTESEKDDITAEMSKIADGIAAETNIENLIRAKGMSECLAVLGDNSANIIVKTNGLTPGEVAQIKEIVYLNADILPKNIKIIEHAE